ncbi:hypothetical protein lerEdw1_003028 [Lerista edwardsae]|nr:hypothetical protein lerEdw1_003028 [Lerista edwardsae]
MASNSKNGPDIEGDIVAFVKYLRKFEDGELRRLTAHFRPDMVYVIENEFAAVCSDLICGKVIASGKAQMYADLAKREDSTKAAEKLVDEVLAESREAAIGLWKCFFALRSRSSHPNLHGMVEEILYNGLALLEENLLNESGHTLDPSMKAACQDKHKSLLCEQTKLLKESSTATKPERKDFPLLNRYVELKVVSDAHFRKQSRYEHEALAAAGELNEYHLRHKTQTELERITPDRLFRWCSRRKRNPCSVMVSGVAGVGKTTLVQKFVYDWARGEHYQKFAFVFYFKFRDLNTVGSTSLENLLLREYPRLRDRLETILQKPENLLFIFDGLDESNSVLDLSRNRGAEVCQQPRDVKPVVVIVASLLRQTLLKGCTVLLTSRPNRLAQLETGVLHRVTSIVGFLSQEREQYFENFFGSHEVAQKAFVHVRDSQVLYTLCYNPSYCWITCTALEPCFAGKKGRPPPLPKTVTQLFVRYIQHMFDHHTRALPGKAEVREMLISLGWLADYGLNNRILVFDQNLLEAFDVKGSPLLTAFLVESIHGDSSSSQVTYSFVHLTVQEFFAALVHYLDLREEEFQVTMARAGGPRSGDYEIFLRFLSGLSHPATRAPLEEVLGKLSSATTKKVIDWLTQMEITLNGNQMDYSMASLRLDCVESKRKALNFFHLLFEAQNPQLVRQMVGDAAHLDVSELYLLPVDCTILSYILSCCRKVELVNLDSCFIQNEGFQKLSPQLHKIREVSLRKNNLRDPAVNCLVSALKHPDCQLEALRLGKNAFTAECCKDLSLALQENRSLLSLDLHKNKLRDEGLSDLLEAFRSPQCRIQTLILQENALSDACCGILSSALAENTSLKVLNLSGNPFTDRCASDMRDFILKCPALIVVRLSLTNISPAVEDQLKKEVARKRPGLKIII